MAEETDGLDIPNASVRLRQLHRLGAGYPGNTSRTHSHTGLSAGDTRHYRVSAISSFGTSPVSNVTTGLPIVSIAPASATEGDDIVFIITISSPIEGFQRVDYGTGPQAIPSGSMGAKKDADYVPHHPAGALVQIGYGATSVELRFSTVDDDLVDGTELFAIGLYRSSDEGRAFSYGIKTAIATIRDDENGGASGSDEMLRNPNKGTAARGRRTHLHRMPPAVTGRIGRFRSGAGI